MPRGHPALVIAALVFILAPDLRVQQSGVRALIGGTIYSSPRAAPVTDGVVILEAGKISAVGTRRSVTVPPHADVINCDGMFVLAGFQNSHVHFTPPGWATAPDASADQVSQQLAAMLTRWGFTTVIDTGSDPSSTGLLKQRIESGEIRGPRILMAGLPLYPANGLPYYLSDIPDELLKILPQPASPDEASTIIRDPKSTRDIVKLFVGSWVTRQQVLPMTQEIASAAAQEAHKVGKLVFAHPSNIAGLNVALGARVDVLAHALDDTTGLTEAHFRRMKQQNMGMVPTLKLLGGDPDVMAEVRSYFDIGGQMLFGTDVGYLSDVDPTREYELMLQAGLTWRDILASLTTNPASRFRESRQRGEVATGMDGDLVVLGSDLTKDVRAFTDVRYTIRKGNVIYRRSNR